MQLLAVFLSLVSFASAYNALLPPRGRACFYDELTAGDKFTVSFQVGTRDPGSSEQLDANFYVLGPQNRRVVDIERVTHGSPTIEAQSTGRYEYCFSNDYSGTATKDVTFHVNGLVTADARRESYHENLDGQVRLLNRLIQTVKEEQEYIVIRERTHRNTAESTNDRIKWWTVLQIVILVANTIFQIFYLKRFFEVRSNV